MNILFEGFAHYVKKYWIVLLIGLFVLMNPFLAKNSQARPLTLTQIKQLIKTKSPDRLVANAIKKRGVAFKAYKDVIYRLEWLGAGPQTLRELEKLERVVDEDKMEGNISDVAIKIGNETISIGELMRQANLQIALLKQFYASHNKQFDPYSTKNIKIVNQVKQNVIQGIITITLLKSYAKQKGITIDDSEVDTSLSNIEQKYGEDDFSRIVNESGMTTLEIRKQIKEQLIAKAIFTDMEKMVHLTDADEKAFYYQNKNQFKPMTFVESKPHLEQMLRERKAKDKFEKLINELKSKTTIDIEVQ